MFYRTHKPEHSTFAEIRIQSEGLVRSLVERYNILRSQTTTLSRQSSRADETTDANGQPKTEKERSKSRITKLAERFLSATKPSNTSPPPPPKPIDVQSDIDVKRLVANKVYSESRHITKEDMLSNRLVRRGSPAMKIAPNSGSSSTTKRPQSTATSKAKTFLESSPRVTNLSQTSVALKAEYGKEGKYPSKAVVAKAKPVRGLVEATASLTIPYLPMASASYANQPIVYFFQDEQKVLIAVYEDNQLYTFFLEKDRYSPLIRSVDIQTFNITLGN